MRAVNATQVPQEIGGAKPRDLRCAYTPNEGPTSELASLNQAVCSFLTEVPGMQ